MARLWRCSSKSVGDNCNIQQGVQVEKQRHFDFGCPGMSSCFEANGTHPARHKSHVEKPTGQGSREARIWHVMQRDVQRRIWHIVDDHMWFLCAQRLRKSTEILGLLGCLSLMKIYEVQRQTCCFMMFPKMLATVYCSPSLVFDENRNAGKWSFGLRELFLLRERVDEFVLVCPYQPVINQSVRRGSLMTVDELGFPSSKVCAFLGYLIRIATWMNCQTGCGIRVWPLGQRWRSKLLHMQGNSMNENDCPLSLAGSISRKVWPVTLQSHLDFPRSPRIKGLLPTETDLAAVTAPHI